MEPNITAVQKCAASVCMCSSHSFWTSSSLGVPAGVTQEESLRGAPLLLGEQEKCNQQILQEVQNFVPHDYIKSCTVYTLVQQYVCVCFLPIHSFWTSSSLDVLAGVTQEEGHTGFLIHLLSAVRALIFLARRIQPFLSLVDCEVEFCVLTI